MKYLTTTFLTGAIIAASAITASAQTSTPLYDQMAEKPYGEKYSVEQRKLCLLALKTYDHGVKELGLDKADSKRAGRAEKGLPFTAIDLKSKTQTGLMFDRAVADVTSEFAVFKAADNKTQKKFFNLAKGPNKTCGKPFDTRKLEGYGSTTTTAKFIAPMSSDDAQLCMSVAYSGMKADRASFITGFLQMLTWEEVYKISLRREGHPDDELIEKLDIKEVEKKAAEMDESKALAAFDSCPGKYKKAKFQADRKKGETAPVPVINW